MLIQNPVLIQKNCLGMRDMSSSTRGRLRNAAVLLVAAAFLLTENVNAQTFSRNVQLSRTQFNEQNGTIARP